MIHDILKIQMLILVISPQCEANPYQVRVCTQPWLRKGGCCENEKCRHMTNFHWFGFFHSARPIHIRSGFVPSLGSEKGGCCENEKCRHMTNFHWFGFFHRFRYFPTAACTRDWLEPSLDQNQGHYHCHYHRRHHHPHLPLLQNRFHHLKLLQ